MRTVSSLRTCWERFWFAPQSTAPVEVFRIVYGALVTAWMVSMLPVLEPFYGEQAAVPQYPTLRFGSWTFFSLVSGSLVWIIWLSGVVAGMALLLGSRTRLAAVVVFAVAVSLTRQAPWVFNSGDSLIRVLAFYMIFMPAGSAASFDRWYSDRGGVWRFPRRAPWALRLAQIQLSVIYVSTVWEKAGGALWRDGTAVSYALRVGNVNRLSVPSFVTDSVRLTELSTYGTLAVELAIGILVWNRAARPWVLALGVALHLSIDLTLMVGFFSFAILTLYLVFLPPQAAERLVGAVRTRIENLRPARATPARASRDHTPTPSVESSVPTRSPEPEPVARADDTRAGETRECTAGRTGEGIEAAAEKMSWPAP